MGSALKKTIIALNNKVAYESGDTPDYADNMFPDGNNKQFLQTDGAKGFTFATGWYQVYQTELVSAATTLTISSLLGDSDVEYKLICRFANDYAGACEYKMRLNNDGGANQYGQQILYAGDTTVSSSKAANLDAIALGYVSAQNHLCSHQSLIHAKSGEYRLLQGHNLRDGNANAIPSMMFRDCIWNDNSNEITSIVIYATETDGLGVGTTIELWARRT